MFRINNPLEMKKILNALLKDVDYEEALTVEIERNFYFNPLFPHYINERIIKPDYSSNMPDFTIKFTVIEGNVDFVPSNPYPKPTNYIEAETSILNIELIKDIQKIVKIVANLKDKMSAEKLFKKLEEEVKEQLKLKDYQIEVDNEKREITLTNTAPILQNLKRISENNADKIIQYLVK